MTSKSSYIRAMLIARAIPAVEPALKRVLIRQCLAALKELVKG